MIMQSANIGFGVAVLENAYDETAWIEAVPAETMIEREKQLVKIAAGNMPTLMIPEIDVLIVEKIGKDISAADTIRIFWAKAFCSKNLSCRYQRLIRWYFSISRRRLTETAWDLGYST